MDPFKNLTLNKPRNKKPASKTTNFIESLKDLGSSIKKQAQDATLGTGRGIIDQVLGPSKPSSDTQINELKPQQPFNFEDFLKSREKQIESIQRQRYERRFREEKLVFYRKDEEAKVQIKAIQEELKQLAKATDGLSLEVKKAVLTETMSPGVYHFNFFERIRRIIELARKQVVESKSWLELFNHRRKQKNFYWDQVKKSGTKFMLSGERYMATQSG